MHKLRSVNTKFWDDPYTCNLDPIEKLVFLYFLTNPLTNLTGIYEITLSRISFDTGLNQETARKVIARFENDKKMLYVNGFIIIFNFMKNQKYNDSMLVNVENTLNELPENIRELIQVPKPTVKPKKVNPRFEEFWDLYNKKTGRVKSMELWNKLTDDDIVQIFLTLPKYVESTPDVQFRKNPTTYLRQKSWKDEIHKPQVIRVNL